MSRAQSFKSSLAVGELGVELLLGQWGFAEGGWVRPPDSERRWDLEAPDIMRGTGVVTLEVKTDTYGWDRTPNFFMEHHTNVAGGDRLLGGPWRAERDGIDWFAYVFLNPTPRAYVFTDVPLLAASATTLTRGIRRCTFGRLSATGALVDRDELLSVARGRMLT